MSEPAAAQHYGSTAKILHWAVAGLVVAQYALANLAELAAEAGAQVRQNRLARQPQVRGRQHPGAGLGPPGLAGGAPPAAAARRHAALAGGRLQGQPRAAVRPAAGHALKRLADVLRLRLFGELVQSLATAGPRGPGR